MPNPSTKNVQVPYQEVLDASIAGEHTGNTIECQAWTVGVRIYWQALTTRGEVMNEEHRDHCLNDEQLNQKRPITTW